MKKIAEVVMPIVACAFLAGCMSPGGAVMTGPLSYLNAGRIDKAKMARSVAMSARIPAEQKPAVISAVNMSMSPNEIAVGYKVDILGLFSSDYTAGELFTQTLAATGDLAAEAAAGWALYDAFKTDRHDSGTVTINGNNNAVNYNNGTGNANNGTTTTSDHNNIPGGDYNDRP